jgi:O-antigen/teichoic acid export membrane protein
VADELIIESTQVPAPEPTERRTLGARLNGLTLMAGTMVNGALNYGYTLVMLHALRPIAFSRFSLMSSLLLLAGSCAAVSVPWALAREVARTEPGSDRRRRAVSFSLTTSLLLGLVAASVIVGLSARYASWGVRAAAVAACSAIFVNAVGVGYIQGCQRFRLVAGVLVLEATVKFCAGVTLALTVRSEGAAICGLAIGAAASALVGVWLMRGDLSLSLGRAGWQNGRLLAEAGGLTAVQGLIALLQAVDVIVIGLTMANSHAAAGYQAMLVLARTPAYLAQPLAAVVFTQLVASGITQRERLAYLAENLRTYLLFASLLGAAIASVPPALFHLVVPLTYAGYRPVLVPLTLAAVTSGVVTLCAAALQARRFYRLTALALSLCIPVIGVVVALKSPAPVPMAWSVAAGMGMSATVLGWRVSAAWPGMPWPRASFAMPPVVFVVLASVSGSVVPWFLTLACAGAVLGLRFFGGYGRTRGRGRHAVDDEQGPSNRPMLVELPAWSGPGRHAGRWNADDGPVLLTADAATGSSSSTRPSPTSRPVINGPETIPRGLGVPREPGDWPLLVGAVHQADSSGG